MRLRLFLPVIMTAAVEVAAAATVMPIDTVIDTPASQVGCHLRVVPHRDAGIDMELRWNVTDSSDYSFARLRYDSRLAVEVWDVVLELETGSRHGGRMTSVRNVYRIHDDIDRLGVSLRLDGNSDGGAVVMAGVRHPVAEIRVDYDFDGVQHVQGISRRPGDIARSEMTLTPRCRQLMSSWRTIDSLRDYIEASSDSAEGIWTGYDSNTDPLKARRGGDYTIATVADSSGCYDIIYLDGAAEHSADWPPLRLKGRLSPATFEGFYDLLWYSPDGTEITHGCGAVMQGDLLTLQFPYWDATLRFRRLVPVSED